MKMILNCGRAAVFENRKVYWCGCTDPTHFIMLELDKDEDLVWVSFTSSKTSNMFRRIKFAFYFLFGLDHLIYGDLVLKKEDIDNIIKDLEEMKESNESNS